AQPDIAAQRCTGDAGRAFGLADVAVQVVEHEADVVVDVPIRADSDHLLLAAGDRVARCRGDVAGRVVAIEVDDAVARPQFEPAPATLGQGPNIERMGRADAAIGAGRRYIFPVLAGEGIACLD